MIQDIQACHFSKHSSTYQLQQEAPHNNISFLMQQKTFGMRLLTKGLVHLVYTCLMAFINIVKQRGRRDGLQCLSIKFPGHAEAIMK